MKHWKLKRESILSCGIILLLMVYMGIFLYLNMAKYAQHVDSDIAAEALLAREIWTEKTLTPDNWIASTERYLFGMPVLASLFYGMTGSMQTAVGIACVLIGAVFSITFYWFTRRLGLSRMASIVSLLALCALPINGLRNDGQMVPFVMLLLFVFADYYALHSILFFLCIIFYLHLKEKRTVSSLYGGYWFFLFGATTVLACGGQRCLQMVVLPLAVVEMISLFLDSKRFSVKPPRGRLWAAVFVSTLLVAYLISTFYKGQADYVVYLLTPQEALHRLFETVPAAILEGFGVAGKARVGTVESVMQILVWAFLALVGYGLILICRDKGKISRRLKSGLVLLLASLGITAFIVMMTSAEAAHNYFLMSWFVAVLVAGILVDYFQREKSAFGTIIVLAVCFFALLNLGYTYKDAVMTQDNLKEYEEVADLLIEEGIEYGYAEFWDAERISLIKDGAVTMGHCYQIEDPKMYWWLTSTKWYPPNLPEQMRTAYVVKTVKKDAFEARFAEVQDMELAFENGAFAVYISDTNYIVMQ